jgi:hypothetical protein
MINLNMFLTLWPKSHMSNMDLIFFLKMQIDASTCQFYQNWFQVDEIFEFSTFFFKVWVKCTYVLSTFNINLKINISNK